MNQATAQAITDNLLGAFTAYLHAYEMRYAKFRVVTGLVSAWPDGLFADTGGHLSERGAGILSKRLAGCILALRAWDRRGPPPGACDLRWDATQDPR